MYFKLSMFKSKKSLQKEQDSKIAVLDINTIIIHYLYSNEVAQIMLLSQIEKKMIEFSIDAVHYLGLTCRIKNDRLVTD